MTETLLRESRFRLQRRPFLTLGFPGDAKARIREREVNIYGNRGRERSLLFRAGANALSFSDKLSRESHQRVISNKISPGERERQSLLSIPLYSQHVHRAICRAEINNVVHAITHAKPAAATTASADPLFVDSVPLAPREPSVRLLFSTRAGMYPSLLVKERSIIVPGRRRRRVSGVSSKSSRRTFPGDDSARDGDFSYLTPPSNSALESSFAVVGKGRRPSESR